VITLHYVTSYLKWPK